LGSILRLIGKEIPKIQERSPDKGAQEFCALLRRRP
jgi:hypothetical protein